MSDATRQPVQTSEVPRQSGGFSDEQMEILMGRILQTGVLLASSVVLIGGVMYLIANWSATPRYRTFEPGPNKVALLHPGALMTGIAHGEASAVIQLGMLLLIGTPVARVLCAVVGFSIEKDRLYVWVSAAVLLILIWSMLHSG